LKYVVVVSLYSIETAHVKGVRFMTECIDLMPTALVQNISALHQETATEVRINPNNADEVYKTEGGKLCLSRVANAKLAMAAGIQFSPTRFERPNNDRVTASAVGYIQGGDGQWRGFSASYTVDLNAYAERLKAQVDKDGKPKHTEKSIERAVRQRRAHMDTIAESCAQNRVIRSLLGMKAAYTPQELRRPFRIRRISFAPDLTDPQVKQMVIAAALGAVNRLYSPPEQEVQVIDVESAVGQEERSPVTDSGDPDFSGPPECFDCGVEITPVGNYTLQQVCDRTHQKFGRCLCLTCAKKADAEMQSGGEQ